MIVSGKLPKLILLGQRTANQWSWRQIDSSCLSCSGALLHTTASQSYPGQEWRKKFGKPANPNSYGQLTDGPDYSFLDGRPTPPGAGKIRRTKVQREMAARIMQLTGEVDFAVTNHEERVKEQKEKKGRIIESKLKPKGKLPPEISR